MDGEEESVKSVLASQIHARMGERAVKLQMEKILNVYAYLGILENTVKRIAHALRSHV